MKIKKEEVLVINHLQNYVIAMIIMFLLLVVVEFISAYGKVGEFGKRLDLAYLKDFINAIPLVFIALFFIDERKEIVKSQNANP